MARPANVHGFRSYCLMPILNLDKVVEQRLVFYVCLDSLPDKAVASALGSILLSRDPELQKARGPGGQHDLRGQAQS